MAEDDDDSLVEKAGGAVGQAARDAHAAVSAVPPAMKQALNGVARGAAYAANGVAPAFEEAARRTHELTVTMAATGAEELTRFGRVVLRAWDFVERAANPPWTVRKLLGWLLAGLAVAVITAVAYDVRYGILTLPMIELAGSQFIAATAALGSPGLFVFTAVGTLFFMVIPTEPFFFLIIASSASAVDPILAAALGSTVGALANYAIGNRLRKSAGKTTGKEHKLGRWGERANSKSGAAVLFLAMALPCPEIVALAYGLADFPVKKFLLITLVGRLVKWTWIAVAFLLFSLSF